MSLGLSRIEAEVYVYLATNGPRVAGNIAENLRLNRQQLSSGLESLQRRKIVISTLDQTIQFNSLPFRRTLALLMRAKRAEAKNMEGNRVDKLKDNRYVVNYERC